jgi:hypothetical protein
MHFGNNQIQLVQCSDSLVDGENVLFSCAYSIAYKKI